MSDVLPKEQAWWKIIRQVGFEISELHDFNFIETPILEPAGLFEAGLGAGTDIVEKQMYTFKTKGGDQVVLRPEGTAPIMRSYFQHHLGYFAFPLKVFYYGPMFRYERPQAGRERQFRHGPYLRGLQPRRRTRFLCCRNGLHHDEAIEPDGPDSSGPARVSGDAHKNGVREPNVSCPRRAHLPATRI